MIYLNTHGMLQLVFAHFIHNLTDVASCLGVTSVALLFLVSLHESFPIVILPKQVDIYQHANDGGRHATLLQISTESLITRLIMVRLSHPGVTAGTEEQVLADKKAATNNLTKV